MSTAKDNANPIIHRPAASSSKATTSAAGGDWWRDDAIHLADDQPYKSRERHDSGVDMDIGMDVDDSDEKREEIDADEIFGELLAHTLKS